MCRHFFYSVAIEKINFQIPKLMYLFLIISFGIWKLPRAPLHRPMTYRISQMGPLAPTAIAWLIKSWLIKYLLNGELVTSRAKGTRVIAMTSIWSAVGETSEDRPKGSRVKADEVRTKWTRVTRYLFEVVLLSVYSLDHLSSVVHAYG